MLDRSPSYNQVGCDEDGGSYSCWQEGVNSCMSSRTLDVGRCMRGMLLLTVALIACVLSYLFCPYCSLGVVLFCFCLCCCEPLLNIPLWIAIFMLVAFGWSWTPNKHFIVQWN